MEISDVKKRVFETIERAKRTAAERRTRADEAAREFDAFLNQIAVPLFRQIASVDHATIGALQLLGIPVKLSETPGSVRTAPPTLGQHTEAVLRDDLGLSAAQIAALRARQAI